MLPAPAFWLVVAAASAASASAPDRGPWATHSKIYSVPALDKTDPHVHVFFPAASGANATRFPLISYAHGALGGGELDIIGYHYLFAQLASFGYVVAAPASCSLGCHDEVNAPYTDCAGVLPVAQPSEGDAKGWDSWYGEQLKTIQWARNMSRADPVLALVDWAAGVGVAGHSMGGQATTSAAHHRCAAEWDIRAAVLHHTAPCELQAAHDASGGASGGGGNTGLNITSVPLAVFTSSGDGICNASASRAIWAAARVEHKLFRDLQGSSHLEPVLLPPVENPRLGTYTAAWFEVYLKADRGVFHDLIYGGGPDALCRSQPMVECTTGPAAAVARGPQAGHAR